MQEYCLLPEDLVFTEDISTWCKEQGIPEPDRERPVKLVSKDGSGCRMIVREYIPDEIIQERSDALRIRGQITNIAVDRADLLDSDRKKLAYLFLSEYATSLPDIQDELLADAWAFEEMERLGFFKK